jgi:hypothetical protein
MRARGASAVLCLGLLLAGCGGAGAAPAASSSAATCEEVTAWAQSVITALQTPPQYKVSEAKLALLGRAARDGAALQPRVADKELADSVSAVTKLVDNESKAGTMSETNMQQEIQILQAVRPVVDRCVVLAANSDRSPSK